jgi:transposase-like protein
MDVLFRVTVSKSAIARWVDEIADQLPSADEMVKILNQQKEITQGHLDELFPLGTTACVLVLKDEHGRLIACQEVENRDEAHVTPFLERLQGLGLRIKTFYIDHCQADVKAITAVYPEANIQFDYFHILQNIWRHLWKEFCRYRKEVNQRAQQCQTKWYANQLKTLATQLWKNRYLFFKSDSQLTAEEKERLRDILNRSNKVSFIRGFLQTVWSIFEDSTNEQAARKKLEAVKHYASGQAKDSGFTKSINFLETHVDNMITFLTVPGVQRHWLAESGMRVLRRLEQSHDGFRSDKARQNALKIYQAVMYLGWSIHDPPNLCKISVS